MYEFHEYANLFPLLEGDELAALAADIEKNGLEEPIHLYEGKILDGRNRYNACLIAGVDPWVMEYPGDDPLGYVISYNIMRRHLTTGQRAMIAAEIVTLQSGDVASQRSANLQSVSTSEAAEKMKVSPRSVETAKTITDPELKAEVKAGKTSLNAARNTQEATKQKQLAEAEAKEEALKLKLAEAKEKVFRSAFNESADEALSVNQRITETEAEVASSETRPKIDYEATKQKLLAEEEAAEAKEEANTIETDWEVAKVEETDSKDDAQYWKERPEEIYNYLSSLRDLLSGRAFSLTANYDGDHHKDDRREREIFLADDKIYEVVWEINEAATELLDRMVKLRKT